MIPFSSDITQQDVERSGKLVQFYLGSYDNITEDNAAQLINLFSDSGINMFDFKNFEFNLDYIGFTTLLIFLSYKKHVD